MNKPNDNNQRKPNNSERRSNPLETMVSLADFVGKIWLRLGGNFIEPGVVYVSGINSFDLLVCNILNTSEISFSNGDDLVKFDYDKYKTALKKHKYFSCLKGAERWRKELLEQD